MGRSGVDQFGVLQARAGAEGDHALAAAEEALLHQLARAAAKVAAASGEG
ncbi:MAG: hypothetical protein U0841_16755 [Chloroflexia bacterium]